MLLPANMFLNSGQKKYLESRYFSLEMVKIQFNGIVNRLTWGDLPLLGVSASCRY